MDASHPPRLGTQGQEQKMSKYPAHIAAEVSALRPDLAANDAIAAVLTTDPTLTASEVIEILDQAAAEYAADHLGLRERA